TRCLSDWSSDVCSSDLRVTSCGWALLAAGVAAGGLGLGAGFWIGITRTAWDVTAIERDEGEALAAWWRERHRRQALERGEDPDEIGRASCRERVQVRGG